MALAVFTNNKIDKLGGPTLKSSENNNVIYNLYENVRLLGSVVHG